MELVASGFAPVPVLSAPHMPTEVIGPASLDRLGDELFDGVAAEAILHDELSRELTVENGRATLRLPLPFAERAEIDLKKAGLEVIVRVGAQKRTIILPPALAGYETGGATFKDGALEVVFERASDGERANHDPA